VAGYDGTADAAPAFAAAGADALHDLGGTRLPDALGDAWAAGRFEAPHLRDSLLTAGAIVETLETATSWSNLIRLRDAVSAALTGALAGSGTPPLVLCHVSHVYPAGASLYFTVVAAAAPDPLAQWAAAKHAAGEAIVGAGATITHHHGVGGDHRPWLSAEIGPLGVAVLQAVKDRLDPVGVLNPGVLVP
jgi:alkyldihydroxyacetonephosphate synthase